MPIFDWLREHPHAAKIYNEANAIKAMTSHRAIIDAYDFSGIATLTDVGGGHGALMAEILKANPAMRGIIAELPSAVQGAREFIHAKNLETRCEVIECDFFKGIPVGSDAYLIVHILHRDIIKRKGRIISDSALKRKEPSLSSQNACSFPLP